MGICVGVDVGGTNLKAALLDENGQVIAEDSSSTPINRGADSVIDAIVELIWMVADAGSCSAKQLTAIGVGAPGVIDFDHGIVLKAPNISGWTDLPLGDRLRQATGRPVVVENDANAAAFGEYVRGAGCNAAVTHLVMLTLGTGVGSGIILDGQIVRGGFALGAEAGHVIIEPNGRPCACGQRGCLEAYASAASVARRAVEILESIDAPSSLRSLCDQPNYDLDAQDVFEAVAQGDPLAERIADETARYLGIFCINVCRLLDPQMIVFAGGMAQAGDQLLDRVRSVVVEQYWSINEPMVQLAPAQLGLQAGMIGAATLAAQTIQAGQDKS